MVKALRSFFCLYVQNYFSGLFNLLFFLPYMKYIKTPKAIQITSRAQLSFGKEYINAKQIRIPAIGTKGTKGVLNDLGASGIL